jgi:hypothetical protein
MPGSVTPPVLCTTSSPPLLFPSAKILFFFFFWCGTKLNSGSQCVKQALYHLSRSTQNPNPWRFRSRHRFYSFIKRLSGRKTFSSIQCPRLVNLIDKRQIKKRKRVIHMLRKAIERSSWLVKWLKLKVSTTNLVEERKGKKSFWGRTNNVSLGNMNRSLREGR